MIHTAPQECPECGTAFAGDATRCHKCGRPLVEVESSDELAPGTKLGSYRIIELLGEGGMGRVYVAEHVKLGRRVAVKVLRQEFATNRVAVARFFGEAR